MKNKGEGLFQLVYVLLLVFITVGIITNVWGYEQELASPSWTPPEIPLCEKELWLRIKDGCDE
jgi:hypothetical protein